MSEENKQEQELEVQASAEKTEDFNPTEVLETMKQLQEMVERQKQEIAGLNRRNSEDQKRLSEVQKQHMSEEERKQAEIAEIQKALVSEFKENTLLKRNIPLEMAGLVQGKSKDEIESSADLLARYREEIESKTKSKLEELERQLSTVKLKTTTTGEPKTGDPGKIDRSKLSIDEATRLYKEGKL
jgi:uncharacterized membrane protein YccC